MSSDKRFRTEHEIWWPQETVTEEKFQRSLNELAKVNFKIDTVLTHTAPSWILSSQMDFCIREQFHTSSYMMFFSHDISTRYPEKLRQWTDFKHWYHGHFHEDIDFKCDNRKFSCSLNSFTELSLCSLSKVVICNHWRQQIVYTRIISGILRWTGMSLLSESIFYMERKAVLTISSQSFR